MLGLVLATLWRRRAQTILVLLLAGVAATGAASAPGYVVGSLQSLAAASVGEAPAADRVVEATTDQEIGDRLADDLAGFTHRVAGELGLTGFATVSGLDMVAVVGTAIHRLAYRDDVCAHLAIEGACARSAGEVMLAAPVAERLGLRVGDRLSLRGRTEVPPVPMMVVGRYRALDPFDAYWGRGADAQRGERLADVGIFTPLATFQSLRPNQVTMSADLIATPEALRAADPRALAVAADQGALRLGVAGAAVASGLRAFADRLDGERQLVGNGVVIAVGELLLVCWLAVFLALRRTAETRRADIAVLKLRGTHGRDLWRLVAAQVLLPVVAGGALGLALGPRLAAWLAGPVAQDAVRQQVAVLTWAASGAAVLGAALAALAAERRTLRDPITTLTRRAVRPGGGRWLAVVDAIVVLFALAGAYQASVGTPGARGRGVQLLAPLLIGLAVGVLAARLIPWVARRVAGRALRAGRVASALAALHLARRAGTATLVVVTVVVVATLTTTVLAFSAAATAREQRAVAEAGAADVLTVRAEGPRQLLAAVRGADPDGRWAMAVVRTDTPAGTVLAVDAARLAAVAPMLDGYGLPPWESLARALHPSGYQPVLLRADSLTVEATWAPSGAAATVVHLLVRLSGEDGRAREVALGPLSAGRHVYTATGAACASACRLESVTLASTVGRPAPGSTVTVHRVDGLAEPGPLADRTRWRAGVAETEPVPDISASPDGLSIGLGPGVPAESATVTATAYVADAPTPLPVVRAGSVPLDASGQRAAVLGTDVLPVRVAGSGRALPEVGDGLLADLEYADRLSPDPPAAALQVWLAPSAPAAIEQGLAAAGITVLARDGITARRAQLDARGPAAALRFVLLVALVALALALLSFAVGTDAERRDRGAELADLRRQGLPAAAVRRVALAGYPLLALTATGIAVATGLLLHGLIPSPLPVFADRDDLAATAGPLLPLLATAAGCALAFAVVGLAAGTALVVEVSRRDRRPSWSG